MDAFHRCTAQLNVDCIPHYNRCFDKYFKMKKEGCKDENRILQAKDDGLAEFRTSVDRVAIAIKLDNDFVSMIKDAIYLKERNQTYAVIQIFENVIDQNAEELKKNPESGFSWWPSKTQMAIVIAVPAAVGIGAGAFAYFCCAGIAYGCGAGACLIGMGVAFGMVVIIGVGLVVYKLFQKKADPIQKIGEKLHQQPKPPHNGSTFDLKCQNTVYEAPKSVYEEIFLVYPFISA